MFDVLVDFVLDFVKKTSLRKCIVSLVAAQVQSEDLLAERERESEE